MLALARVTAFMHGRTWVLPEDVKEIFCDTARHRIARTVRAQAEERRGRRDPQRAAAGGADSMIPEHVMHELRYIEVYTAKKIRNQRVGAYQSPLRGPGFDFDEHQPYRPGDDVRRIDWNVTARMDAPFVRHTHAERELNVMIAMDVSRSMELGSVAVLEEGSDDVHHRLARVLRAVRSDQHRASGVRRPRADVDAAAAHARGRVVGAAEVLGRVERTEASGWRRRATLMMPAIEHLVKTLKRMSVVFIVSDFMTDDDVLESRELAMLAARHDVIAVVPEDPAGACAAGRRRLHAACATSRSGREVALGLSDRARRRYAEAARERRDALTRAFYRVPMDHVFVPTDQSPVEPVLSLFAKRMKA